MIRSSQHHSHDVYDVTCGSILGMAVTYFSYRRYFPRLHSSKCHEPFPSREAIFNQGFGKIKNDEETEVGLPRDYDISDNESEGASWKLRANVLPILGLENDVKTTSRIQSHMLISILRVPSTLSILRDISYSSFVCNKNFQTTSYNEFSSTLSQGWPLFDPYLISFKFSLYTFPHLLIF